MIKLRGMHFPGKRWLGKSALLLPALVLIAALFTATLGGCNEEPTVKTTVDTTPTATAPPYQRQTIAFYRGIDEPRATAWEILTLDRERLHNDGFNTATLSPPVLITQRAGGQPRLILEGDAGSVPGLTDDLHQAGFAVFISPTTSAPGYETRVEVTEPTLRQLSEDASHWAGIAQEKQAELFTPLAQYNLALGTETANKWSAEVLPVVRQKFSGGLVASVVADIAGTPPAPGAAHDFEQLDLRGYDYLMVSIAPRGKDLDQAQLESELDDLLTRANAIAQRDGLQGVLLEFGAWRETGGSDPVDGPLLGEDGQALVTERVIQLAAPRIKGFFWRGWTLPGRGAKGLKVEEALRHSFGY